MPAFEAYAGPINCDIDFDTSVLKDKVAIVTGGANGLGEAYVRALHGAGAYVCIGDMNVEAGKKLEVELSRSKFVQTDVTKWDDQVKLFKEAAGFAPSGRVSYVVANAGITGPDPVFAYEEDEPAEPSLKEVDVNVKGVLYTAKLAQHYFIKQNGQVPLPSQEDTCLILIGSVASFIDGGRAPLYGTTKWAVRGLFHNLRRMAHYYGSRVNLITPWLVRTTILTEASWDHAAKTGLEFGTIEDAAQCLLRLVSDPTVNGRSLFISPRKWAPRGYIDLDNEDIPNTKLMHEIESTLHNLRPHSDGLYQGTFATDK